MTHKGILRLAMGRTLCIAAGFLAVASSLRVVTTPLRHCTVQPRRAVISASATNTTRLLEECAKGERSLSLINSAVAALEQDEVPKKLGKALLGDWQLAFAGDQEAADMLLSSKAGPLLTIEGALLCFNKRDEMRAIEVSRPFGPFSNKRKVLEGRWGLEKTGEVRFRYTYLMEGRSRREEDVPESAKGTQIAKVAAARRPPPFSRRPLPAVCFLQPAARSPQPAAPGCEGSPPEPALSQHSAREQVTHVSEELLVLRRSETSFLLLEKVDLQEALEELRAADTVEDDKALSSVPLAGGQGSSLPPMPKMEMPKLELPKGLPKLPKKFDGFGS